MDVLLFGGTREGRELALWLAEQGWQVRVCVATRYGASLIPDHPCIVVSARRLTGHEMERIMTAGAFPCVIDATHPYAVEVTQNIRAAAETAGLTYYRLVRQSQQEEGCLRAASAAEAVAMLKNLPGNILLTIGSKELAPFAASGLVERCFPRVLPALDSLRRCLELGFPPQHVVCMQGPFSKRLNRALMEQLHIAVVVTKDTGCCGGFQEKAEAAKECGCTLLVIQRPQQEDGMELEALKAKLKEVWG